MNKIVILGRGLSLKKIVNFKEEIDTVILVNEFWDVEYCPKSYYKDEFINNFLQDKKIILICSKCCDFSNIEPFLKKYNVIKKFRTNFSKITRLYKKDSVMDLLPDELIQPFINQEINFKNCGTLGISISYAIYILKVKNIFIFGLDFYEKDYYLTNNYNYKNEMNKSNLIKKDWVSLFKFFKNTKFNIYTLANFKNNLQNINLF